MKMDEVVPLFSEMPRARAKVLSETLSERPEGFNRSPLDYGLGWSWTEPRLFVSVEYLRGLPSKEAKRVRFGLIDVVLAVVFIILLVLLIRRLVS